MRDPITGVRSLTRRFATPSPGGRGPAPQHFSLFVHDLSRAELQTKKYLSSRPRIGGLPASPVILFVKEIVSRQRYPGRSAPDGNCSIRNGVFPQLEGILVRRLNGPDVFNAEVEIHGTNRVIRCTNVQDVVWRNRQPVTGEHSVARLLFDDEVSKPIAIERSIRVR